MLSGLALGLWRTLDAPLVALLGAFLKLISRSGLYLVKLVTLILMLRSAGVTPVLARAGSR